MLNKFCDSPIHKWCAFSLAFIFLFAIVLSIPAFADDVVPSPSPTPFHMRPNDPVGWKDGDTLRDILLVVLDDWGINFSTSSEDSNTVLSLFDYLFEEFLEVTNQYAYEFWADVKYGVDQVGNLLLDFTGVNKIRLFANWLKDRYNLSDNSSYTISDFSLESIPVFNTVPSKSDILSAGFKLFSNPSGDWYASASAPLVILTLVVSDVPGSQIVYRCHIYSDSNTVLYGASSNWNGITESSLSAYSPSYRNGFYYANVFVGSTSQYTPVSGPVFYSQESYDNAIISLIDSSFSITVNTRDISIPVEDFSPDDGLQIQIPGTNWGDSIYDILDLIERLIVLYDNTQLEIVSVVDTLEHLMSNLQRSVTVENIPGAVTLDYDDYDIPLENEWGLFDIFYNTDGDEITLLRPWQELKSIIYGFPAPVLSFFALVVLFVVAYGFIRMGRDSH